MLPVPPPVAIVVGADQVPSALCVAPIRPISGSALFVEWMPPKAIASPPVVVGTSACVRSTDAQPSAALPGTPFATSFAGEVWKVSETMSSVDGLVSCSHVTTAVDPRIPISGTVMLDA